MSEDAPDVLTTQQAARLLGLSTSSVQKLVSRGELPAWVTPGGHRRIAREAVQAWVRDRRQELAGGAREGGLPDDPSTRPNAHSELASEPSPEPAPRVSAAAGGLRVLLAEDDPDLVLWFRHALQAHHPGHVLQVATDASQALILLERERPHLLVTDLMMQPFDGFHLLRTWAREPAWASIEVLVMSGLADEDIKARGGLPAGVTFYAKPASLERLFGLLDGVWARSQRL